jgi:tyrosine-protein phosphatase YwqE
MIDSMNGNINDAQNDHLKGYRWEKFTDIHCHCLAGLDDGPATMAESLALCRRLAEEDIATVVATDSHNMDVRRPRMKAAFGHISTRLGKNLARLVCIENPSRVVNGQEIVPISLHNQQEADR